MDGISQVGIIPYEEWVQDNEATVDLLLVRYKRKGVTLSEEDGWKYLAWAIAQHDYAMRQVGGPQFSQYADQIKAQVADACAQHFTMKQTGVLPAPVGPRFDQPINFGDPGQKETFTPTALGRPDHVYKGYL